MKKRFLPLLMLLMAATMLQAQIFSDDFESYTAGQHLAQQAGLPWTTWSGATGGAEDPVVTDIQAQQGSQSFVVEGTNDCVLLLGDSVNGRYKLDFYIYVPSGKLGYYNLLATFAGSNSEWATQLFFDLNGNGTIDAGGSAAATFTFNNDQWIHMEHYIDLDNDWSEVYINGQYLYDWQWTAGATGTPVPDRLAAADFYAWTGNNKGVPQAFYDHLTFSVSPLPDAPQNLTASLTDTIVDLQWDPPSSGSPDSYYIYRNGHNIGLVSSTSFTDTLNYPGTYSYAVKAYYTDGGMSAFSNSADVLLEGGVERNYVLVEIGTGTGCPYCPGAAMGADDMIANGDPVAVIEYHAYNSGDPFNNPESAARTSYYGITGFPTAYFDGGNAIVGGSYSQSLYPSYHPVVMDRAQIDAIFDVEMDVQPSIVTDTSFSVDITVTKTYNYYGSGVRLFLALTETDIPYNWQNQSEINNTCRAMYPDANGTPGTFELNVPESFHYDITLPDDYVTANCKLIAFVQDVDTKEVLQTQMVDLGQVVGIAEQDANIAGIYPNPASGNVTVNSALKIKHIALYDISGRTAFDAAVDSHSVKIDVSSLPKGIYMMRIKTSKRNILRKLIVE